MKWVFDKYKEGQLSAAWLESIVITLVPLGVGFLFFPEDPFLIHAQFPWLWLATVLVALRYDIGFSILSVTLVATVFTIAQKLGYVAPEFPKVFFFGGLMLAMLCGQFRSIWGDRLRRATQLSDHATERLEQISRSYYVLRLSHDRMEQNLITKPVTLRGALTDLRRLLSLHGGELTPDNAKRFLSLLSQYCTLEGASLHLVKGKDLEETPIATIGQTSDFNRNDELVNRALEKGATSYHAINELTVEEKSRYLVVTPLIVSDGKLLGLLLIEKMPFLSLNRENLQVLGVLLGYFADQVYAARSASSILTAYPDCPPEFAAETLKLARMKKDFNIEGALVSIGMMPDPRREEVFARLQRLQRGLDYLWRTTSGDVEMIVTLMPFAGRVSVEGYLARISLTVKNDFDMKFDSPVFKIRSALITDDDVMRLFKEITVEELHDL